MSRQKTMNTEKDNPANTLDVPRLVRCFVCDGTGGRYHGQERYQCLHCQGLTEIEPPLEKKVVKMSMMAWLATEGGRKCPQCGKYAKPDQLGWNGMRTPNGIVDMWGHLDGYGCNK